MRDPDRIACVLGKVGELWRMYPDWRLGQLLANVAAWRNTDVWDMEEEELTEEIDRHIRQTEHACDSRK